MSTTYSLVCHDCKERHEAGHTSGNGSYHSPGNEGVFLYHHIGHKVEFVNDLVDREELDDYQGFGLLAIGGPEAFVKGSEIQLRVNERELMGNAAFKAMVGHQWKDCDLTKQIEDAKQSITDSLAVPSYMFGKEFTKEEIEIIKARPSKPFEMNMINSGVHQYYYKIDTCKAKDSKSEGCECWHDEGTWCFKEDRHTNPDSTLRWRVK